MSDKTFVAETDELPPGSRKVVKLGDVDVAILNVEGKFYAIKDSCPHLGEPLSMGALDGMTLACPGHGWKFDIKTGRCVKGDEDISLRTFDTMVEGDRLYVVA